MATQTTVTYLDDIDGTKAAETIFFGLDGAQYSIDLGIKNANKLRKAVAEFIERGRPVTPSRQATHRGQSRNPVAPPSTRTNRDEMTAIRAWASDNGIEVAPRGRLSLAVMAQYEAATAGR